jgi:uncharacterized protein YbjQ (UPF0145 family)
VLFKVNMQLNKNCTICNSPSAHLSCGTCNTIICKSCAVFIDVNAFAFLEKVPEDLLKGTYCPPCYETSVAPAVDEYQQLLERAKQVNVYFKAQSKETRLMKRSNKPINIVACDDRDEAILRLAFLAAKDGYNALIDVDIKSEKVRDHAFQKLVWHASAIPVSLENNRYHPQP